MGRKCVCCTDTHAPGLGKNDVYSLVIDTHGRKCVLLCKTPFSATGPSIQRFISQRLKRSSRAYDEINSIGPLPVRK